MSTAKGKFFIALSLTTILGWATSVEAASPRRKENRKLSLAFFLPKNDTGRKADGMTALGLHFALTRDLWCLDDLATPSLWELTDWTSCPPPKQTTLTEEDGAKIARRLSHDFALLARLSRGPGKKGYRLEFRCLSSRTRRRVWQHTAEGSTLPSLLRACSRAVLEMAGKLGLRVGPRARARLAKGRTKSAAAFRENTYGLYRQYQGRKRTRFDAKLIARSRLHFQKALRLDPHYGEAWCNLGWSHAMARRWSDSTKAFHRALELRPSLQGALGGRAYVAAAQAGPKVAKTLFRKVRGLSETFHSQTLATMLLGPAIRLRSAGAHRRALPLFAHATAVLRRATGKDHPIYGLSLNELAYGYDMAGARDKALPLYQRALDIMGKALGETHPRFATVLNDLAVLYKRTGDYGAALPLQRQALAIRKKTLGEGHALYTQSLNNVAACLLHLNRPKEAIPLLQKVLSIRKKTLGKDHRAVGAAQNDLALAYKRSGAKGKALPLFGKALGLRKRVLGAKHPDTVRSASNLANILRDLRRFKKARRLYEDAYAVLRNDLGERHPDTAIVLGNLAVLHHRQGQHLAALKAARRTIDILERASAASGGESYSQRIRMSQGKACTTFLAALARLHRSSPRAAKPFLSDAFRLMEIARTRRFLDQLQRAGVSRLGPLKPKDREEERNLRERLGKADGAVRRAMATVGAQARDEILAKLQRERTDIRSRLTNLENTFERKYPRYMELRKPPPLTVEKLRRDLLRHGETLIAYWSSSTALWAVVVTKSSLGFGRQDFASSAGRNRPSNRGRESTGSADAQRGLIAIDDEDDSEGQTEEDDERPETGPAPAPRGADAVRVLRDLIVRRTSPGEYKRAARKLYQRVVAPFLDEKTLKTTKVLYIVPHGALTALPFEGLLRSDKGSTFETFDYLFDAAPIVYVPSASVLLALRKDEQRGRFRHDGRRRPALLIGDPVYTRARARKGRDGSTGGSPLPPNAGASSTARALLRFDGSKEKALRKAVALGSNGVVELPELPASREEITHLARIFHGNTKDGGTLMGPAARESSLKALDNRGALKEFRYVHFATHGILPDEVAGLCEPCLALSLFGDEKDDGFLKMGEIFCLRLRAELVTLSACQTAIEAQAENSQGISGLARAFFFAGTPRLIATLWKISDKGTARFMKSYYGYLQTKGATPLTALSATRHQMIASEFAHPYYWAPFILLGSSD